MKTKIPNLNTFSTLLDRLSIENVKMVHFENSLRFDKLTLKEKKNVSQKIKTQKKIIISLKKELNNFLVDILTNKKYEFIKEERTFN